jgi:hypothetical protein
MWGGSKSGTYRAPLRHRLIDPAKRKRRRYLRIRASRSAISAVVCEYPYGTG